MRAQVAFPCWCYVRLFWNDLCWTERIINVSASAFPASNASNASNARPVPLTQRLASQRWTVCVCVCLTFMDAVLLRTCLPCPAGRCCGAMLQVGVRCVAIGARCRCSQSCATILLIVVNRHTFKELVHRCATAQLSRGVEPAESWHQETGRLTRRSPPHPVFVQLLGAIFGTIFAILGTWASLATGPVHV